MGSVLDLRPREGDEHAFISMAKLLERGEIRQDEALHMSLSIRTVRELRGEAVNGDSVLKDIIEAHADQKHRNIMAVVLVERIDDLRALLDAPVCLRKQEALRLVDQLLESVVGAKIPL